ncbi:MAG: Thioredoxin domain containing protein [Acidobacteria bacterium]|nr:Thioredoxin domain containing protein [Acidobacteriota bacterium]
MEKSTEKQSKFTNHLINETSPYLLQHAHNPVDWYAWGDAAFEKAKREDKPILISIGYSACHWCHVMEHESFENEETARIMNERFVNIKVDLEERPDVDQIYMTFVQMLTGHGGYPLNVFLTPEKLPFFGGTYFPPVTRHNMPSFPQILQSIADAYENQRDEILNSAKDILKEIRRAGTAVASDEELNPQLLDAAFRSFEKSFDRANGGFGGAPKFPVPMSLEFLLGYYKRTGNESALEMVEKTCKEMAYGGIHDRLGGGFHRYTVDAAWLVPHFEKMLYDNAQLAKIYLHLFQVTKDEFYKRVAIDTLEYVRREMTDEKGGFYTAQDADSEGVEGKFFVWTPDEIIEILGEKDARVFNFFYDVTEHGNFEEKNILNVRTSLQISARQLKMEPDKLSAVLERGRKALFNARETRVKPFRDEKVLTAWNGLMLRTFAEASAILESEEYLETAKKNADFIMENLQKDGYLLRAYKDGRGKLNAYLEDYANFADGLIELFQVSGEAKYLFEAKRLTDLMIEEFWDKNGGGFFFTGNKHEELIARGKEFFDNAAPSGNSAATDVLLKLAKLTGEEEYERKAATILSLISSQIKQYPQAFGRMLSALEFYLNPIKEIVVLGEKGNELEKEIWKVFLPDKVVVAAENAEENAELIPLLKDRKTIDGKATAYVCENYVCQKPVTTIEELKKQLI